VLSGEKSREDEENVSNQAFELENEGGTKPRRERSSSRPLLPLFLPSSSPLPPTTTPLNLSTHSLLLVISSPKAFNVPIHFSCFCPTSIAPPPPPNAPRIFPASLTVFSYLAPEDLIFASQAPMWVSWDFSSFCATGNERGRTEGGEGESGGCASRRQGRFGLTESFLKCLERRELRSAASLEMSLACLVVTSERDSKSFEEEERELAARRGEVCELERSSFSFSLSPWVLSTLL